MSLASIRSNPSLDTSVVSLHVLLLHAWILYAFSCMFPSKPGDWRREGVRMVEQASAGVERTQIQIHTWGRNRFKPQFFPHDFVLVWFVQMLDGILKPRFH